MSHVAPGIIVLHRYYTSYTPGEN